MHNEPYKSITASKAYSMPLDGQGDQEERPGKVLKDQESREGQRQTSKNGKGEEAPRRTENGEE